MPANNIACSLSIRITFSILSNIISSSVRNREAPAGMSTPHAGNQTHPGGRQQQVRHNDDVITWRHCTSWNALCSVKCAARSIPSNLGLGRAWSWTLRTILVCFEVSCFSMLRFSPNQSAKLEYVPSLQSAVAWQRYESARAKYLILTKLPHLNTRYFLLLLVFFILLFPLRWIVIFCVGKV